MQLICLLVFSLFCIAKIYAHGPEFNDLSPLIALPLGIISVVIGVSVNLVEKGPSKTFKKNQARYCILNNSVVSYL